MSLSFLDVHNVEYGECIVISPSYESILMVDCGSMNTKIKESNLNFKEYVQRFIVPRYYDIPEKIFLLTHFHRDHICGLYYILKENPHFFDCIYLPKVISDKHGRPYLLELALYASVFLQRNCSKSLVSTSSIKVFSYLKKTVGVGNFFTIAAGEVFYIQTP